MQTMTPKELIQYSESYTFPYVLVYHEMNVHDRHRLRIVDVLFKTEVVSHWYSYDAIAVVESHARKFCGTTEYYAGVLPRVFRVEESHVSHD